MIKVGIIGYGFSAKTFHLPFILSTNQYQLVAISTSKLNEAHNDYPQQTIYASADELIEQAEIDLLTGLKNRRSVMSFLQAAVDQTKIEKGLLSVMMIDLDHFKTVNDNYGHLAGDLCLKQVAQLIKQNVRNVSDLAGRFGGEEFIVVIKDIDAQKATQIANNIRTSIEHATVNLNDNKTLKVTVTIGICTLNGDQLTSIEHCVDLADKALYAGKNAGRNRIVVSQAT